jgi:hypothetical protein
VLNPTVRGRSSALGADRSNERFSPEARFAPQTFDPSNTDTREARADAPLTLLGVRNIDQAQRGAGFP